MHLLVWILTLLALGLWSRLAWGTHVVLTLDPAVVGNLKPLVEQIPYGALIEQWVPGWQALLTATIDLTQSMLGWLGGAAGIIVWIVWGLGALLVVGGGVVGSVIVALVRKGARAAGGGQAQAA
jgi:hypothetical protein